MTHDSAIRTSALAAIVALAGSAAHATVFSYTETGDCSTADFTPNSDDCFGTVLPEPVNASEDPFSSNSATVAAFNEDIFGGTTGLFGYTTYEFVAKSEGGGVSDGLSYTLDGTGGGTFDYTGDLSTFDFVVYVLKQGNTFSTYLWDTTAAPTDGEFSLAAFGENTTDLSHLSIFAGGEGTSTIIPLPAPALLLLGGLGALGALRVRRKKA